MDERHLTVVGLAHAAGVDAGYLRRILAEKPLKQPTQMSVDVGIKIAKVLDLKPDTFAVLQAQRLVFERMAALETQTTASSQRGRIARAERVRRNHQRVWAHPKP